MAEDRKDDNNPEFKDFKDLTRKLLKVTKEDLDRARERESDALREGLPDPGTGH